jgi:hypothetical protein
MGINPCRIRSGSEAETQPGYCTDLYGGNGENFGRDKAVPALAMAGLQEHLGFE